MEDYHSPRTCQAMWPISVLYQNKFCIMVYSPDTVCFILWKLWLHIPDSPVLFCGSTKHSNLGLAMTLQAPLTASVLSGSNFVCQVGDVTCLPFCVCYFFWFSTVLKCVEVNDCMADSAQLIKVCSVQWWVHRGGDGRELSTDKLRQQS